MAKLGLGHQAAVLEYCFLGVLPLLSVQERTLLFIASVDLHIGENLSTMSYPAI